MNNEDFRASIANATPPEGVSAALSALWWQRKGDWEKAHETAQADNGAEAAWVHALLHREEGDLSNARHWYLRASRDECEDALEVEWDAILAELLPNSD